MRAAAFIAVLAAGICAGFWTGQTYGQLQVTCAIMAGSSSLSVVSHCAGGPGPLARYVLTRTYEDQP